MRTAAVVDQILEHGDRALIGPLPKSWLERPVVGVAIGVDVAHDFEVRSTENNDEGDGCGWLRRKGRWQKRGRRLSGGLPLREGRGGRHRCCRRSATRRLSSERGRWRRRLASTDQQTGEQQTRQNTSVLHRHLYVYSYDRSRPNHRRFCDKLVGGQILEQVIALDPLPKAKPVDHDGCSSSWTSLLVQMIALNG